MRKEPFGVGGIVHVYNRGNRKADIVRDESDRWRFLAGLRFFNDRNNRRRVLSEMLYSARRESLEKRFEWPLGWQPQDPLVRVLAYCVMPNHYHLLLQEINAGGVTEFIRKLGTGFTNYMNWKYDECGKIFQGSYQAKLITNEYYLQYADIYIQALNPIELIPDRKANDDLGQYLDAIVANPFSGLGETINARNLHILDRKNLNKKYHLPENQESYEKLLRDAINKQGLKKILGNLSID